MKKQQELKTNSFQTEEGNTIWCGALCLAWHDLASTHKLQRLDFLTKNSITLKIIRSYNNSSFKSKDIDPKSVYIKTGKGPDTQNLINKQIKIKFPKCSFPDLEYSLKQTDIVSVAYLWKQINFDKRFQRRKQHSFLFNGKKVASFYADEQTQKKQIKECYFKNRDDFCIKIADRLTNDVLYFIKTLDDLTVDDTLKIAMQAQQKGGSSIKNEDSFEMPVIEIDCEREVKQMIGQKFACSPLKGYKISVMVEAIKINVDESGAKMENRAMIFATKCCKIKNQTPRQFVLDKTFWMIMKEVGRHPYACFKIVNPMDK